MTRGVTLVELMVVLVVLAVMAGVVGLAWRPGLWQPGTSSGDEIAALRRRAAQSGHPVSGVVGDSAQRVTIVAYPDGRIVGAARFGVNPLTGGTLDADTLAR
jgi:prepilin-type N-terminal cleavage/methylation domain-containing protein